MLRLASCACAADRDATATSRHEKRIIATVLLSEYTVQGTSYRIRLLPVVCLMLQNARFLVVALVTGLASLAAVRSDDKPPRPPTGCAAAVDNYFEDEVWAKVGVQKCLTCHKKGGDAEESKFLLLDP